MFLLFKLKFLKNKPLKAKNSLFEWWDERIICETLDTNNPHIKIREESITTLVEHPIPFEPPTDPISPQLLMLTPRELKKIRMRRRSLKEKEKLEAIRQGLIDTPKPKVKLSKVIDALGVNFVADPTQIEQEIRRNLIEKQHAHDDRNLSDKLTPLELKRKKARKLFNDGLLTHVSVYRISGFDHPQNKYKVDINAIENRLSGARLQIGQITIIVVEGCSKSQRRFFKLMNNRIDWKLWKVNGIDVYDESGLAGCDLIWRGTIKKPNFERFRACRDLSEAEARKFLRDHNSEHYWDIACKFDRTSVNLES